jgi:hypothetical protein
MEDHCVRYNRSYLGCSNPLLIDGREMPFIDDIPLFIGCLPDLGICLLFVCPLQAVRWPSASYLGLYNTRCPAVS